MAKYIYIDEQGVHHNVVVHNFNKKDDTIVRIMGNTSLNPTDDTGYKDKKWVKRSEVLAPAVFSEQFVKNNSFN